MSRAPLALIVAMARNRVIGRAGTMPWHAPLDLKHFKQVTTGHTIIMGRRTHQSIGRALPGRRNLVVTRDVAAEFAGCEVVRSLDEAVRLARLSDALPFVIGGGELYAQALPLATHLFLTELAFDVPDGDTFFPAFNREEWREVRREVVEGLTFTDLERPA